MANGKSTFLLSGFLAIMVCVSAAAQQAQQMYMGYIDFEKVRKEYKELRETMSKMEDDYQKEQERLDGMSKQMEKKKKTLEEQIELFASDKEKQEKIAGFQAEVKTLVEYKNAKEGELQKRGELILQPMTDRLRDVVKNLGKEKNISFIFKESNLAYANPAYDLTDEVIKRINALPPLNNPIPATGEKEKPSAADKKPK